MISPPPKRAAAKKAPPGRAAARRAARLTVENVTRRLDPHRLERLRAKAAASEGDDAFFWSKYLEVDKWISLNIRYAQELGFIDNPPRNVLDLGCGGGYFLAVCREAGAQVLGLDLDRDAILNELIAMFRLKRVAWNIQPLVKLPRLRRKFDLITAWMICFNLPMDRAPWNAVEWDFLLADLRDYLEPNGRLILSLNKQLDDGLIYNEEVKDYFSAIGAKIDGKRLTLDAIDLQTVGAISAHVPRPPPRPHKLFNAVRPANAPAPRARAAHQTIDCSLLADFSADDVASRSVEARTLFFLASWQRNARVPLTLVCVGEPPDTVAWLAERASTKILAQPPDQPGVARAWAAPGNAERVLMMTPEMLVFADPAPALAGLEPQAICLAPADRCPVPDDCWPLIYEALGVPAPSERIQTLRAELRLQASGKSAEMWPYYRDDLIFAAQDSELPRLQREHLEIINRLLPQIPGLMEMKRERLIANARKIALATASQSLVAHGAVWRRMPLACDGRIFHFEAAAEMSYPCLLHLPGLFKRLDDLGEIRQNIAALTSRWRTRIAEGARDRGFGPRVSRLYAKWVNRRLENALDTLYRRDVRPALRACGVFG